MLSRGIKLPIQLIVSFLLIVVSASWAVGPEDLFEHWPMNNQTGNIISGSVNGLDGTLLNGPVSTRAYLGSKAISFDGVDDYVDLGTSVEMENLSQGDFSLAMWIKTEDITNSLLIGNFNGNLSWSLLINNGGYLQFYLDGESHYSNQFVSDGQWHHIAVSRDLTSSQVRIYIDGGEDYSAVSSKGGFSTPTDRHMMLGRDSLLTSFYYEGLMDDVSLYSVALIESDVEEIIAGDIQGSPLGTYIFPAIPPKTVWHGSTYSFLVEWPGHEEAIFDLLAIPEPVGEISVERVLQSDTWIVSYTPDDSDVLPFEVILSGAGDELVKQSFEFLPMAHLSPEQEIFDIAQHTGPGPFASEDVVVHENNGEYSSRNYQSNKYLKHIELVGKTIVWENTPDSNDLFDSYSGRRDLQSMTMTAETVIIKEGLHFPQCNIVINAHQLLFEGSSAQIKTTPIDNPVSYPGDFNAGGNGLPAGNIELNIDTFSSSHIGVKFDIKGGRGQDGGKGQSGTAGQTVWTYTTTFNFSDWPFNYSYTAPAGEKIIFKEAYALATIPGFKWPANGSPAVPTDGTDAISSGKPGKGGASGNLSATSSVASSYIQMGPGVAGNPPISGWWYYGGSAGTPNKWIKMRCDYWPVVNGGAYWKTESYEWVGDGTGTKNGSNAAVPRADSPSASDYGSVATINSSSYAWMQPVLMRSLFSEAKDAYLSGNLVDAQFRMEELASAIEEYRVSGEMASISDMDRFELNQLYDHMRSLLYQIENNFDYFGHPAGWVPMLSFEVNLNLFNNEIDRAIEQLYLAHWITRSSANSTEKLSALQELRVKLQEDIDTAYDEYETGRSNLTSLKDRAEDVKSEARDLILQLQAMEVRLASEADNNLTEPWWKTSVKVVGLFCKYVPVLQPVTGTIGGGIDVAMNYDPDDPYQTVIDSFSLADSFVDSVIQDAAAGVGIAASVAAQDVGGAVTGVIEAIGDRMPSMTDYVNDSMDILQGIKAPISEIRAEMSRLKALSPEFKVLAEDIEGLMELQSELARDIAETMLLMTDNANIIRESLLAMDALQDGLANVSIPDDRALQYIELIERRAFDRLLEYHYYVAKSYEYRMLKKYTQPLDLEQLFTELATNTQIGSGGQIIPEAQFTSLKGIYTDIISNLINEIASEFNATGPSRKEATLYFELTANEKAKLNSGETINLNLANLANERFPLDSQDIRILNIEVEDIETSPLGGNYEETAFLDVIIRHKGLSRLMKDGRTYMFQHFTEEQSNPFEWGSWYYPALGLNEPVSPSPTNASLIYAMLTSDGVPPANDQLMLYAHPAVWADFEISIKANNNAGKGIQLDNLMLAVIHDFTRLSNMADVRTEFSKIHSGSSMPVQDNDFMPYVIVDKPLGSSEISGRTNGRGQIHRVYNPSSSSEVNFMTQRRYGDWKFCRWTDQYNNVLSSERQLSVVPDAHKIIRAQFCPLDTLPGDLNHDCVVNNIDLMILADSWQVAHGGINLDVDDSSAQINVYDLKVVVENWLRTCDDELEDVIEPTFMSAPLQGRYMEYILD